MEETKTTTPIPERAAGRPIEGLNQRKTTNTVSVDLHAYMPLLEDVEITDAEKLELLHSLYAIMKSFIDLGFQLDFSMPACGQGTDKTGAALSSHIYSQYQTDIQDKKNAAACSSDAAGKGAGT
nr:hypothetical protein [uncultured Hyphomonas sp.]